MPAATKTIFDPATDLVDIKGKVVLVTGGSGGIGLEIVRCLARAGAKVYMGARNESRATGAIALLENEGLGPGHGQIHWFKLDLTDPRDVKKAGQEFVRREKKLDILIHNAGDMSLGATFDKDGMATTVTVNYIGPFILTQELLPVLKEAAKEAGSDVRIVYVSSLTHKMVPTPVKFESVQDFNLQFSSRYFVAGLTRYGYSKLMGTTWCKTLQRQLDDDPSSPITVISLHPGGTNSPVPQGALTPVFAAASREIAQNRKAYGGAYLSNSPIGVISDPHPATLNQALGDDLWTVTQDYLTLIGL